MINDLLKEKKPAHTLKRIHIIVQIELDKD